MVKKKADKLFLITVLILAVIGFVLFTSASLGLISRDGGAQFGSVALTQFLILIGGLIAMFIVSGINYKGLRRYTFWIYLATILLTILVFVPQVGFSWGGAKRWILIAGHTFQPAELLKLGYVLYLAYWLSSVKNRVRTVTHGLLPFVIITSLSGLLLLAQPDIGTFMVVCVTGLVMFFAAGGRYTHLLALLLVAAISVIALVYFKPYIKDRVMTFFDPSQDTLGSAYQINQSLIAIGSGGLLGRGFGQSVQKFYYLPEPIGDSIFAVIGEEFGFLGASLLCFLFAIVALLGLRIAAKTPDSFGRLMALGLVILIISQSFINIASMLGLIPLTGEPLPFVSHGGSSLLAVLLGTGIILNISKFQKAKT